MENVIVLTIAIQFDKNLNEKRYTVIHCAGKNRLELRKKTLARAKEILGENVLPLSVIHSMTYTNKKIYVVLAPTQNKNKVFVVGVGDDSESAIENAEKKLRAEMGLKTTPISIAVSGNLGY